MAGKPKGKTQTRTAKRCAYQHGDERCMKWTVGTSTFCTVHAQPLPPAEAAEVNALGAETAAVLREELGLPVVERKPMAEEVRKEEPRREEPAMPAAAVKDPVRYAMQLALDQVAKAYAEDNECRANSRNPGQRVSPTERARMSLAAYMPELDDPAAMVARDGRKLVKPGWIGRWVRDKDEDGRPNTRRYRMFIAIGCEDVLDDDGRPLIGRLGRAVQMPPEVYAARVLKESSSGAFDSSPYIQGAMEMAEATNRAAGRKVVDVRPTSDHSSHREFG